MMSNRDGLLHRTKELKMNLYIWKKRDEERTKTPPQTKRKKNRKKNYYRNIESGKL